MKRQLQCSGTPDPTIEHQSGFMSCKVEWYCVFNAEIKSVICFQNRNLEFKKSKTGGSLKADSSSGSFFGQCHTLSVGDVNVILLPLTDTAFLLNTSSFSIDFSFKQFPPFPFPLLAVMFLKVCFLCCL